MHQLSTFWLTEEARSAAARSGREFSNPNHSRYGKIKPYSTVGSKHQGTNQRWAIRRNYGRINNILAQAGIGLWQLPADEPLKTYPLEIDISDSERSAQDVVQYLEKAVLLGVRNGWTEERRTRQAEKMKAVWEMRKKSGREDKPLDGM
jgi:hypothetical protein